MKKLLIISLTILFTSCVSQMDRIEDAKKKYPKTIVQPPTSLLHQFDVMVEDTINNQIYVLDYYPFSTTKIRTIRNVK